MLYALVLWTYSVTEVCSSRRAAEFVKTNAHQTSEGATRQDSTRKDIEVREKRALTDDGVYEYFTALA